MSRRNIFAAEWFVYGWDEATVLGDAQRVFLRGDRKAPRMPEGIAPNAVMVAGDPPAKVFAWQLPIDELPGELHLIVTDETLLDEIMSPAGRQGTLGDMDPDRDSRPMTFPPRPLMPTTSATFDDRALSGRPLEPFERAAILFVGGILGAIVIALWALAR